MFYLISVRLFCEANHLVLECALFFFLQGLIEGLCYVFSDCVRRVYLTQHVCDNLAPDDS